LAARADALPDNDYAIDLFQGPLLAPIRVTGIAGAYAGYAEAIEGMVVNAAAPAVREPNSVSWIETDISGSLSIPLSLFDNNDFDNSGTIDYDYSNFLYLTAGGLLQVGRFGVGLNAEFFRYTLTAADGATTSVTIGKYHALVAVRVIGDSLMVGAGARVLTLGLNAPEADLTLAGAAPEVGLLVRPDWKSYRLGATFRFPVNAGGFLGSGTPDAAGVERAGGLALPQKAVQPWELEIGTAVQVGPRPLNPAWIDPHDQEAIVRSDLEQRRAARADAHRQELRLIADTALRSARQRELDSEETKTRAAEEKAFERTARALKEERRARYWNWPREHLLVTAEILIIGPTDRGVGIAQFLGQNERPGRRVPSVVGSSGASVNFSPRFGIETEPIVGLVHTRFGSYYEPSRFERPVGRQHFTFGADLKLFPTTFFGLVPRVYYKLQSSFDVAPRYQSASLGIGVWH
jgi:hypothetical protein